MKIFALMKAVPDTESVIEVKDGSIDTSGLTYVINPYDEYAIEQALQTRDKIKDGSEVAVVSVGGENARKTIEKTFGLGIDMSYQLSDPAFEDLDPLGVAQVLASFFKQVEFDMILAGRVGVDDDQCQVAVMLAELLGIPHIAVATAADADASGALTVEQEVDAGKQVVGLNLPAVVTVQKGINNPRYASAIMIMKGKKKPREIWDAAKVGFTPDGKACEVVEYIAPPQREAGRMLTGELEETVPELVRILSDEKKLV